MWLILAPPTPKRVRWQTQFSGVRCYELPFTAACSVQLLYSNQPATHQHWPSLRFPMHYGRKIPSIAYMVSVSDICTVGLRLFWAEQKRRCGNYIVHYSNFLPYS